MMKSAQFVLTAVCAASFCFSNPAQGNPHGTSDGYWALHLPFDLEPSETANGGRALGMGNAFVAVADDVRAAMLNPAGLIAVQQTDLAADISYSSYEKEYMDTYAAVNNIGLGPDLEELRTFDDSAADLPFAGAAFPVIPERLTASLFYRSAGFTGSDSQNSGLQAVLDPSLSLQQQHVSEKIIDEYQKKSYGAAAAFRYSKLLTVGLAVSLETLAADMRETWTAKTVNANLSDSEINYGARIDGDDMDMSFSLGTLLTLTPDMKAALSFRTGSSFSIDSTSIDRICSSQEGCSVASAHSQAAFDTPDIWSLGLSWRPAPDWLLSAQADWVEYSALTDESTTGVTLDEDIDDDVIVRFGAEKSFAAAEDMQYQLRAGFFRIPDHDGFQAIDSEQFNWTLGGGLNWNNFAVDLGTSFSDDTVSSVLSLTYSM